jgi:TonB family protein
VGVAVVLALLAHMAYVGLLLFLSLVDVRGPPYRPQSHSPSSVTLRPLTTQEWARNRGQLREQATRENESAIAKQQETPKPPEEKKEKMPKGQVVDVAPGNGQEAPDAKYLAEKSNRVNKETKSKEQTPFYRNAMPKRTSSTQNDTNGKDNADRLQIAGNNGLGNDDRPLREAKPGNNSFFEIPDVKRRQEVAMRTDKSGTGPGAPVQNRSETAEVIGNSNRLRIQKAEPGGKEEEVSPGKHGAVGIANLVPSFSVLDKIAGAAPNDHLADVEEGDGTFLNTKEWKYSTFFNRVKQSVGMHWDPGSQLRLRDPTGTIYGGKDRFTLLNVTLNSSGGIKNISVEKSCGIDFLDAEAIGSFERAQPFPNPPPGLLATDSTVHFQFGFFLEMGGGPRLRLFRQAN